MRDVARRQETGEMRDLDNNPGVSDGGDSNVAVIWDMWKKSEIARLNALATSPEELQPVPEHRHPD